MAAGKIEIVREITLDVMWLFIFCHLCWLNQQKYLETKCNAQKIAASKRSALLPALKYITTKLHSADQIWVNNNKNENNIVCTRNWHTKNLIAWGHESYLQYSAHAIGRAQTSEASIYCRSIFNLAHFIVYQHQNITHQLSLRTRSQTNAGERHSFFDKRQGRGLKKKSGSPWALLFCACQWNRRAWRPTSFSGLYPWLLGQNLKESPSVVPSSGDGSMRTPSTIKHGVLCSQDDTFQET